jgi:tRNA pseudouridine38-40 synthase
MDEADPRTRVRLDLSYDGTDFSGWAAQPGRRTVQAVVESVLATVLRVPAVALTVAGRTDAGVHAVGQVAHADLNLSSEPNLLARLAGVLPPDVRVNGLRRVPADFDARFGALWRRYEYRISDRPTGVAPLRRRFVLDHRRKLDENVMAVTARALTGLHDFAAFCKHRANGTTVRSVETFTVERDATGEIAVRIQADAFCHSMVRSLVGALITVGEGRRVTAWATRLLDTTSRSSEVAVVAPHGLTLVEVGYPPDDQLAARVTVARARRRTEN